MIDLHTQKTHEYCTHYVGPFPQNSKQHFLQHIHGVTQGVRGDRWRWWWLALIWSIWQQRNKIIFSDDTFDANKIMDDASFLLWAWLWNLELRNLEKDFNISYSHWSSNLRSGFVYQLLPVQGIVTKYRSLVIQALVSIRITLVR